TGQRLANGTTTSYTYDAANRQRKVANLTSAVVTLSSFEYGLDPVGNRLRVVEANGDRVTWTYDAAYQLIREQRSGVNAERQLAAVGTPEYHETLCRALHEAEAVLVLNPFTEAMLSPHARRVVVVPWGMDPT